MSHSPLPWRFEPLTCDDDRGMGYIVDANGNVVDHHGDSAKWKHENLENAELKIRAVNCHAELLEAARRAHRVLLQMNDHEDYTIRTINDLSAALKNSEAR